MVKINPPKTIIKTEPPKKVSTPKIKVPLTPASFTGMLKEGKCSDALKAVLKDMSRKERIVFAIDYIQNSKFKSYRMAMKNFVAVVGRYLETEELDDVKIYQKNLVDDHSEYLYSEFVQTRRDLLEDILKNDANYTFSAIRNTIIATNEDSSEEQLEDILKGAAAQAGSQKWKEAKGLAILYGANNGKTRTT